MFPVEPVPERIGAYEVLKHVGRSGAADVYVARMDGPLGFCRDVTLKLVSSGIEEDARFAEELAREASICARLNHPVVVRMFDFFEYTGRLVLVLEQVEGSSLDWLMVHLTRRKQKLSDAGIFYLASQIASALAHAHTSTDEDGNLSPVIDRDIKPENVLVGWDGNVRLAGFGLGKILGRTPDSIAGTVRGTPGYMSPEQARGERATVRSDVYGFGVLLWSLLTGREPPTDGTKLDSLGELRPDLPRELVAALEVALEPSPDCRRISCSDLAQWLAKLTKPEAGREELRQKALWLRATRGPASAIDSTNKTTRVPKRRQAIQATRPARRPAGPSSRPPSSYGPPSSRSPSPSSRAPGLLRVPSSSERPAGVPDSEPPKNLPPPPSVHPRAQNGSQNGGVPRPQPGSQRPTARPDDGREDTVVLKLPPPPPLPNGSQRLAGPHGTLTSLPAVAPPPEGHPASSRPPSRGTASVRPPSTVSVRTVSTPPSARTMPPMPRPAVPVDDLFAASAGPSAESALADGQGHGAYPHGPALFGGDALTSSSLSLVHSRTLDPARTDSDTVRPARPTTMTFTLTTQLLLAALTAGLVVALGLLINGRPNQAGAPPPPPQVVTVEVSRPGAAEATRIAERAPDPIATSQPAGPEKGSADVAASAPPPSPLPGMPDPAQLPDGMGYLMVKGPDATDVYINGVRRGPTNEAMMVACGQFFVRLAPKDVSGPFKPWVNPGQTVVVECKGSTTVTSKVGPPDQLPGPGFRPTPSPAHPTTAKPSYAIGTTPRPASSAPRPASGPPRPATTGTSKPTTPPRPTTSTKPSGTRL